MEQTLSIIKPEAVRKNLVDKINQKLVEAGLKIVKQKTILLTKEQAEFFYAEHSARPFFGALVAYMMSGEVVVQVLEGLNSVSKNREIMGATDPKLAAEGTIRKEFGESIEANAVHGSDSIERAKVEIDFFFSH